MHISIFIVPLRVLFPPFYFHCAGVRKYILTIKARFYTKSYSLGTSARNGLFVLIYHYFIILCRKSSSIDTYRVFSFHCVFCFHYAGGQNYILTSKPRFYTYSLGKTARNGLFVLINQYCIIVCRKK